MNKLARESTPITSSGYRETRHLSKDQLESSKKLVKLLEESLFFLGHRLKVTESLESLRFFQHVGEVC